MSIPPGLRLGLAALALGAGLAAFAEEPNAPALRVRHEDAALVPLPWALPTPDSCRPQAGLKGWPPGQDAPPMPFEPGQTFAAEELPQLRDYLPPFIWEYRERFFYPGMKLEIGSCFRDYSPPAFFQSATAAHAGQASLGEEGELFDYEAGLPFPPDRVAADDPRAGLKWAWNFELRYQGAGFWGKFRTADMVGREGRAEPFIGEIFRAQVAFRSDRAERRYQVSGARGKHWVAGGLLFEPFDARHYAWRQYRDVAHLEKRDRSDDVHAYLPDYRRVRRVPATGVEGIYMPSFSVGVMKPTNLAGGFDGGGAAAGIGLSAAAGSITIKRSGFEGLELRPLLYEMRLLGVQDVLTPINASSTSYPSDPHRDFGPWGLSFASDRWDLRRAVVIEGRAVETGGGDAVARFIQYLDVQTLASLYYASWDPREEQLDVGMMVGRWSEERAEYPPWPDDPERPVRAIDTVGSSFAHIQHDGGWRRESWEMVSVPPEDSDLKRQLSVSNLTKRH